MHTLALLLTFTVAASALGAPAQADLDFAKLKERAVSYAVLGTICEQVAKLRLEDEFPAPAYSVETGIEYKRGVTTLGELDVIVFRASDGAAVLVGEVKCRPNLTHAVHLAKDQLDRFKSNIEAGGNVRLAMKDGTNRTFALSRFADCGTFVSISQDGGKAAGFDRTIGLDLDAALALRDRLIACQAAGECVRP